MEKIRSVAYALGQKTIKDYHQKSPEEFDKMIKKLHQEKLCDPSFFSSTPLYVIVDEISLLLKKAPESKLIANYLIKEWIFDYLNNSSKKEKEISPLERALLNAFLLQETNSKQL